MNKGMTRSYVTITLAGQLFGIPVPCVRNVQGPQPITRVPLAPPEVAGALSLRGQIVTVIDVRRRLNLPPRPAGECGMGVVVEYRGDLYSLLVDGVGEVIEVQERAHEASPATFDPHWRQVCSGVLRLDDRQVLLLEVDRLLGFAKSAAAA